MVTKEMSEAAKKFLNENPHIDKALYEALFFVTLQPISNKTPDEADRYAALLDDMKTRIKRDYYSYYVPSGSIRVRSYVFGVWPNMLDEAKVLVAQDINEFAQQIMAAGFFNFEIHSTQIENLGRGLKVEAMIDFRYGKDDAAREDFYNVVGKLLRESKAKAKKKRS